MVRPWHFPLLLLVAFSASGCASDGSVPAPLARRDSPPTAVIGLDRRSVESHWGSPVLLRPEGPGELWQYRSTDCVVDVFFYPATDALRVVHLTVRPAGWSPNRCLERPLQSAGLTG